MDFSISEEQLQLRDAVRRFGEGEYPQESRGNPAEAEVARRRWQMMAELGLIGLCIPEGFAGSGLGMVEQMFVSEELGRCLSPEPYLSTAVIAASLIRTLGSAEQQRDWLLPIANGERRLALALSEPGSRYDLHDLKTLAHAEGAGYLLDGEKTQVLDGGSADALLVVAGDGQGGSSLFLVPCRSTGVEMITGTSLDGRELSRVRLSQVRLSGDALLGAFGEAGPAVDEALDRAVAALCAEGVGAMSELVEQTTEYLKVRKQFGSPLGRFQALQHRLVDMLIALEQARSMACVAALAVDSAEPARRQGLVSAAKVRIGRAARLISKEAIQMHGAMGMTDECRVGHYVKRLLVVEQLFGDVQYHLQRFRASPVQAA